MFVHSTSLYTICMELQFFLIKILNDVHVFGYVKHNILVTNSQSMSLNAQNCGYLSGADLLVWSASIRSHKFLQLLKVQLLSSFLYCFLYCYVVVCLSDGENSPTSVLLFICVCTTKENSILEILICLNLGLFSRILYQTNI